MSAGAGQLGPFADRDQRRAADTFGMFVFLTSEVMLFGGLFAMLAFDRIHHPGAAAKAAQHLDLWLGAANTGVLLTSSLFVALGDLGAREGRRKGAAAGLFAGAALGLAFLVLKGVEYRVDYVEGLAPWLDPRSPLGARPAQLFIGLYYVATALHALHVAGGVALLAGAGVGVARGRLPLPARAETVRLVGLYWHLVDVIWVFLFPLLYLARP
jgi:cytochrome c oxidase subunit 3